MSNFDLFNVLRPFSQSKIGNGSIELAAKKLQNLSQFQQLLLIMVGYKTIYHSVLLKETCKQIVSFKHRYTQNKLSLNYTLLLCPLHFKLMSICVQSIKKIYSILKIYEI